MDLALKEASRAIERAEESPAAWTEYGRILAEAGRLSEAERALKTAVRISPSYADAHVYLADVFSRKGLTINATLAMRRAVELKPDVPLYRELLGSYEKALERPAEDSGSGIEKHHGIAEDRDEGGHP